MSRALRNGRATRASLGDLQALAMGTTVRKRARDGGTRIANLRAFADLDWGNGVLGFGLAQQRTDLQETGTRCLRFYVARKRAKEHLRSAQRVPTTVRLARQDGCRMDWPTDVIELGDRPELQAALGAGASIGSEGLSGTLGAVVQDRLGRRYALTCAHVVAPWWKQPPYERVQSPAAADAHAAAEIIGTVADWTELDSSGPNTVDAALVALEPNVSATNQPLHLGPGTALASLTLKELGRLHGQTVTIASQRGHVTGILDSIGNDLPFNFTGREFRFFNIVGYRAAVQAGDSGAAVMDEQGRVIGLHFAGQPSGDHGYCIPSRTILTAFASHGLNLAT